MTPLDEANLGWARAERERDEARTEADQLRLAHSRLLDTLREYDCDYGCGCTHRHCPEGRPCLAHRLDEVREELRVARLGAHAGQSCEMLAARLVAVEWERDDARAQMRVILEGRQKLMADVARRQREACAAACAARCPPERSWHLGERTVVAYDCWSEAEEECKATPLVTEETP